MVPEGPRLCQMDPDADRRNELGQFSQLATTQESVQPSSGESADCKQRICFRRELEGPLQPLCILAGPMYICCEIFEVLLVAGIDLGGVLLGLLGSSRSPALSQGMWSG